MVTGKCAVSAAFSVFDSLEHAVRQEEDDDDDE
jgi:hypothetical protein